MIEFKDKIKDLQQKRYSYDSSDFIKKVNGLNSQLD